LKNTLRFAALTASLVVAASAQATGPNFQTASGTDFTNTFFYTPATTNAGALVFSGLTSQYSALTFQIEGGPSSTDYALNGNLLAFFNDPKNLDFNLIGGTTYTVVVDGTTKANLPGGYGLVSITTYGGGTITPVPEPASYAMILAGLGLMAAIARRRANKNKT
jgi:hypothetical protein